MNYVAAGSTQTTFLPLVSSGVPAQCRFGVNVIQDPANVEFEKLNAGWYLNYRTNSSPILANFTQFVPVIRLSQTGPNAEDFSYTPSGTALLDAIAENPGADWLIGNEPDRAEFQDDMEPHVYAAAYAELYDIIKTADPTARIFAGTIVQPTPLRLEYLDLVLDSYAAQNSGAAMPVDGWSIHNFILNEVSCDYDPGNCWGAEIPPGIDADFGEILTIDDNDNMTLFTQRIENFRQWMADRGYAGLPLTVSEYGVLMPDFLGFDDDRVNTFMNATFDYMLTATDPVLGDPNDNYRLVQTWSWFSTGAVGDEYNGYLFEGVENQYPWKLSAMGQNYADYAKVLVPQIDLYASDFSSAPASLTAPATITLTAQVANSGTNVFAKDFVVRFYDGDPQAGGTQIGADQPVSLAGCGHNTAVSVVWPGVSAGSYELYVVVDTNNNVVETDEQNNTTSLQIVVNN
ncbi:CARDB domain-containing protein [Candidatus Leptofilum sp.]|uniref:CARDB domain-containing protein n=1 Tax=Candidatus Leptofilum sp. TaxID=3241576 RepID=UPI003B5BDF59